MRYLSLPEILELHEAVIEISGGALGIRDIRALESSVNQPRLTFNQADLYPGVITKAAALGIDLRCAPTNPVSRTLSAKKYYHY